MDSAGATVFDVGGHVGFDPSGVLLAAKGAWLRSRGDRRQPLDEMTSCLNGSETPKSAGQDVTTNHGTHAGFMDPVAQHVKLTKERQHHVRNTALEEAETQRDGAGKQVPYQHGDPEY